MHGTGSPPHEIASFWLGHATMRSRICRIYTAGTIFCRGVRYTKHKSINCVIVLACRGIVETTICCDIGGQRREEEVSVVGVGTVGTEVSGVITFLGTDKANAYYKNMKKKRNRNYCSHFTNRGSEDELSFKRIWIYLPLRTGNSWCGPQSVTL
ncbi:hypothetical protein OIU77_009544 [Salix suchowensis]|uniref:Uncharacterized protein n=1 Tax=Salix suchowensis TaxID=1278906 RepID=A0ABQ9AEM1_9ROSI|nr:hypothetical protein OIU77_009544 [Salix suchowensis]